MYNMLEICICDITEVQNHCLYLHLVHIMYYLVVIQLFGYSAASVQ